MSAVVYRSRVRVVRENGPYRTAQLPATEGLVEFGVHSAVAAHYGVNTEREIATTIDYVVAAAGG
ncbi:MAG: hypothetical protein MJB57_08220 [Gemmatimonadetes bacterium]|nr:hypothetical protein [Gemmatimonadota bacterium]